MPPDLDGGLVKSDLTLKKNDLKSQPHRLQIYANPCAPQYGIDMYSARERYVRAEMEWREACQAEAKRNIEQIERLEAQQNIYRKVQEPQRTTKGDSYLQTSPCNVDGYDVSLIDPRLLEYDRRNREGLPELSIEDIFKDVEDFFSAPNPVDETCDSQELKADHAIQRHVPIPIHEKTPTRSANIARDMLMPSPQVVPSSEKRKRGRPPKTKSPDDRSVSVSQISRDLSLYKAQHAHQHHDTNEIISKLPFEDVSQAEMLQEAPKRPVMPRKPGRPKKQGPTGMTKRDREYADAEKNQVLYDIRNIHELLYPKHIKPGREVVLWVQRHPYGNTSYYDELSTTWCRSQNCKMDKTLKHRRTVIAGQYQIMVDYNHVPKDREDEVFRHDMTARQTYYKRDIWNTIAGNFHLGCFEEMINIPQLVRAGLVQLDLRWLKKDRTIENNPKQRGRNNTNPAEIEYHLIKDAKAWMEKVKSDHDFNPSPGAPDSLEQLLVLGKKAQNDKKGVNLLSTPLRKVARELEIQGETKKALEHTKSKILNVQSKPQIPKSAVKSSPPVPLYHMVLRNAQAAGVKKSPKTPTPASRKRSSTDANIESKSLPKRHCSAEEDDHSKLMEELFGTIATPTYDGNAPDLWNSDMFTSPSRESFFYDATFSLE